MTDTNVPAVLADPAGPGLWEQTKARLEALVTSRGYTINVVSEEGWM